MNCRCPKCSQTIEFDPETVTEHATPLSCPSCRTSLMLVREEFCCRSRRVNSDLVCSHCGTTIGHEPFCTSCGTPFPSYYLAEDARGYKRRIHSRTKRKIRLPNVSFELLSRRRQGTQKAVTVSGLTQQSTAQKTKETEATGSRLPQWFPSPAKRLGLLVSIVVAGALAFGGYYLYRQKQMEKAFASQVMKSLYRVKGGKDLAAEVCAKMLASASSPGELKPSNEQQKRLNDVSTEIERALAALTPPSKQYQQVVDQIKRLEATGKRYRSLALSPPPAVEQLASETKTLEKEFSDASAAFRQTLPEKLKPAFDEARRVYKPLQNF